MLACNRLMATPTLKLPSTLTAVQAQVVLALAQGRTVTSAAAATSLHRSTIYNWFDSNEEFAQAVREARADSANALYDELRELSSLALSTVRSLLENPATPPFVRFRVALAILERTQLARSGWSIPETVASPEEEFLKKEMAAMGID